MQGAATGWRLGALIVAGLAAVAATYVIIPLLFLAFLFALTILLGAGLSLLQGNLETRRRATYPVPPSNHLDGVLSRVKVFSPPIMKPILLSPNVDKHIEQVLDLIMEHNASPTYLLVAERHKGFFDSVVPQVWVVLGQLVDRIRQIDSMKFVSQNLVNGVKTHFEHFRGMDFKGSRELPGPPPFKPDTGRYPYLDSREKELDFLRRACEVLLCTCVPRDITECAPVRALLREFLITQVLQPTADTLCDPDNVNLALVSYFAGKEEKAQALKSAHTSTFEDFISHINRCDDVVEMQQIRQNIITEIVQAKAVEKMRSSWSTGVHGGNFPIPIPAEKAKTLMERDLGVYTTQLGTAKTACERRLRKIGGHDFQHDIAAAGKLMEANRHHVLPRVPLLDILVSEPARSELERFLECSGHAHLLHFWRAAENMKATPQHAVHLRLRGIYDEFLSPTAPYSIYADPTLIAQVERYLKYETEEYEGHLTTMQGCVCAELNDNFYEEFLQSTFYHELMTSGKLFSGTKGVTPEGGGGVAVGDDHHKQKLEDLRVQLGEKQRALEAIPVGELKLEQPLELRRRALERDVTALRGMIKKLENYITRTVEWFDTIGQWNVEIVDVLTQDDPRDPRFTITVHRPEASDEGKAQLTQSSASENKGGWVICRTLTEFENLHAKLVTLDGELQFPSTPSKWLSPFTTTTAHWEKHSKSFQVYLRHILQDSSLRECEEVFNFLSPAVESLRNSSLLGFTAAKEHEDQREDSIFEPIYLLAREIFELDDWSRIVRKQSLELVHLTYGKNLDQQFQESLAWMFSEPMLVYYLDWFKERRWPGGKPAPSAPVRTEEEKRRTREEARRRVLDSVPQVLQVVLGQDSTQLGFRKFFEVLQSEAANRQLFYSLFEQLLLAVVPEVDCGRDGD
eukprot:Em0008g1032a